MICIKYTAVLPECWGADKVYDTEGERGIIDMMNEDAFHSLMGKWTVEKDPKIPTGTLRVEYAMINPPKPIGVRVMADGELVATITLEDFRAACQKLGVEDA